MAMTSHLDIRQARSLAEAEPLAGRAAIPAADRAKTPLPLARRCPECGRLHLSDSELAGTCEYCPGLVRLVAA